MPDGILGRSHHVELSLYAPGWRSAHLAPPGLSVRLLGIRAGGIPMTHAILGIDIAKDTFAVALLHDTHCEQGSFPNTTAGMQKLLTWLKGRKVAHVHACMEATGTYGEALALTLYEAGHTVSVVNPARIAAYAKSQLARNKTGAVDAQLIARFCLKEEPPAWSPPTPEIRDLRALVRHLEDLQAMRQAEANRLQPGSHP